MSRFVSHGNNMFIPTQGTKKNEGLISTFPNYFDSGHIQIFNPPFFEYYHMNRSYYTFIQPMLLFSGLNDGCKTLEKCNNAIQELINFEQFSKYKYLKQDKVYLVGWNAITYLIYSYHYETGLFGKIFRLLQLIRIQTVDMYFRELHSNTFEDLTQHINLSNYIYNCLESLNILKLECDLLVPQLETFIHYDSVVINIHHKVCIKVHFKSYLEYCLSKFDKFHESMDSLKNYNDSIIKYYEFKESNSTDTSENFSSCLKNAKISVKNILKEFPQSI